VKAIVDVLREYEAEFVADAAADLPRVSRRTRTRSGSTNSRTSTA